MPRFVTMKNYLYALFIISSVSRAQQSGAIRPIRVMSLTEPTCLEVQADELPPDPSPFLSNPGIDEKMPSMLGRLKKILKQGQQFELHQMGMKTAKMIYDLPDLETARKADKFVDDFFAFLNKIPSGYSLYYAFSDPRFGLKYAILRPNAETQATPWILTIAGTQTMKDWIGDADLGRKQLERLSRLFTKCLFRSADGQMLFNRKLLVTGHSLGGGLAQAISYEILRRLAPAMPDGAVSPVTLVTWNAFGAQELVGRVGAYDPALGAVLDSTNYFVRGDLVSKIGHAIGTTREMVPDTALGVAGAHKMDTIIALAGEDSYLLNRFNEAAPPFAGALTGLSKLGFLFVSVPQGIFQARRLQRVNILTGAADLTANTYQRNPATNQIMRYIRQLAADEKERMLHDGQSLQADSMMKSINDSDKRLRP